MTSAFIAIIVLKQCSMPENTYQIFYFNYLKKH